MKEISPLLVIQDDNDGLNYFREGIRTFILTYEQTGSTQKAFDAYQNYLAGGK